MIAPFERVGYAAGTATVADGSPHAFRWTEAGGLEDLQGDRPGYSWARGINDHGDVVGYYSDGNVGRAFFASNAAGSVTGHMVSADLQQTAAFRYSDARGFEQFGTFGGSRSFGWGINSDGIVVGSAETTPGYVIARPFRARPGFPMEDLIGPLGQKSLDRRERFDH